ncbi:hypothetical protein [Massilia violaceinigra]|uniref:hypothetical protein n=1 Tax=Massilia violaceinigra TaxID=2045208 RepID=UPI0012FD5A49|nr:hypothetical protein [Massilia violaceinigra]
MSHILLNEQSLQSESHDLEQDKYRRQEQSRWLVTAGHRSLEQNSFIPQEVVERSTYTFKG